MYLLVLEFVAFYIHGVQLLSLIVLIIGSPNQCLGDKDDELDESVPMDMDKAVAVNAWNDMKIHIDPVEVDLELQDLTEID